MLAKVAGLGPVPLETDESATTRRTAPVLHASAETRQQPPSRNHRLGINLCNARHMSAEMTQGLSKHTSSGGRAMLSFPEDGFPKGRVGPLRIRALSPWLSFSLRLCGCRYLSSSPILARAKGSLATGTAVLLLLTRLFLLPVQQAFDLRGLHRQCSPCHVHFNHGTPVWRCCEMSRARHGAQRML